jgi:thiol-disulfide isomerase/thioredoxin
MAIQMIPKMKDSNSNLLFLLIIFQLLPNFAFAKNRFFEERYRGWLWFEEKEQQLDVKDLGKKQAGELTKEEMEQAKRENEQFKEELELLRHVMIRYPDNLEHVRRYKEKEKVMLENSMKLSYSFAMTNFLNPDIADQLQNPQNLYGRRAKKEIDEQTNAAKLKEVATKVELFLFFKGGCGYCTVLEKHLARFASRHGFKVEAISEDGTMSKLFKTHYNKALIEQLALEQMPTVIAVTNDSRIRFELARGAVSVADLEENALLMAKYLETQATERTK